MRDVLDQPVGTEDPPKIKESPHAPVKPFTYRGRPILSVHKDEIVIHPYGWEKGTRRFLNQLANWHGLDFRIARLGRFICVTFDRRNYFCNPCKTDAYFKKSDKGWRCTGGAVLQFSEPLNGYEQGDPTRH